MNIIELAKKAGFVEYELDDGTTEAFDKRYAKFAALVARHEREECAKLCDNQTEELYASRDTVDCAEWLAQAIRARGEA